MNRKEIAKMIDHTLLAAFAKKADIEKLCKEADKFQFASVCVNPIHVKFCADLLKDSSVSVCTVIGFPLGAVTSADKADETKIAVANGADEVDMVIDVGSAKDGRFGDVEKDIKAVVDAAAEAGKKAGKKVVVKVILETCYLTDEEIVECCKASKNAGADFVKTSTGFGTPKDKDGKSLPNGASAAHVALMRKTVGEAMGVKASGGVRTAESALEMVKAGANRIGTSNGVTIVEGWKE